MGKPRTKSGASVALNSLAAILLSILLALGIFVSVKPVIIAQPSDGYSTLEMPSTSWNIAVAIIGTAVGILASIAFSTQDALLSRRDLISSRGASAIFLRPLTSMRSFQQLLLGELNPERTALVLLTLGTTLTSAATVALFSVQTATQEAMNPYPSYPLSALNGTFFKSIDGGVYAFGSPTSELNSVVPYINSFVYRSAFINGQAAMTGRLLKAPNSIEPFLPEQALLGETTYRDLWTAGVGININSYLSYQGPLGHFKVPANYTFGSLEGYAFGTTVNVTCQDRTDSYSRHYFFDSSTDVQLMTVSKKGSEQEVGNNITVSSDMNSMSFGTKFRETFCIGSNITLPSGEPDDAEPVHVFLIAGLGNHMSSHLGRVLECTYDGQEFVAEVSVASTGSPLVIGDVIDRGPLIGPAVKRLIASNLQGIFGTGNGGVLARGFNDANYNKYSVQGFGFEKVFGTVLSQSGQAFLSAMRQAVEIVNLAYPPPVSGVYLTIRVTVQRIGGGAYGWLVVYGVLLLGCFVGLFRALRGGEAVAFEAQDAVILLAQAVGDETLGSRTKVQFVAGVGVVRASPFSSQNSRSESGSSPTGRRRWRRPWQACGGHRSRS